LLLVVALTVSVGGHWAVLQGVAWVTMAAQFAQTDPWRVVLQKTFDGQHPCELCKAVQKGKASEKQKEAQPTKVKLELGLAKSQPALVAPDKVGLVLPPQTAWLARPPKPLVPPPRPA
jgi:hypothetical protein